MIGNQLEGCLVPTPPVGGHRIVKGHFWKSYGLFFASTLKLRSKTLLYRAPWRRGGGFSSLGAKARRRPQNRTVGSLGPGPAPGAGGSRVESVAEMGIGRGGGGTTPDSWAIGNGSAGGGMQTCKAGPHLVLGL